MSLLPPIPSYRAVEAPSAAAPGRGMASPNPAAEVASAPALPNPSLRLEPALGLVVMEFRNSAGEVAETIPTQRELEAYRSAARGAAPAPQTSSPPAGSSPSSPDKGEAAPPAPVPAAATT